MWIKLWDFGAVFDRISVYINTKNNRESLFGIREVLHIIHRFIHSGKGKIPSSTVAAGDLFRIFTHLDRIVQNSIWFTEHLSEFQFRSENTLFFCVDVCL